MSNLRPVLRRTSFGYVYARWYHVYHVSDIYAVLFCLTQVSVGIENIQDIIMDFEGALKAVSYD
jgi:hypothetical protein